MEKQSGVGKNHLGFYFKIFQRKRILIIVAIGFLLCVIGGRLLYLKIQTHVIKEEYPISKIETYQHWVTVYPSLNTTLSDFVDMSLFYGFKPKMTFDDALLSFGKPNNIRAQKEGNIYYEYWRDRARVEVVREETSSGDYNYPIDVSWALYTYPNDITYDKVLNPKIVKYINPTLDKTVVVILNQKGDVGVLVEIIGNRVENLIW
ncbi:hypothetical protein KJ980_08290 [Patescibacteria group bacterium]|nr:hypothetical protein [Patescibacteria group bacterium]MBU4017379.1 hypothetical protein [Patescibacteria group bacterium]MBU4099614.1 hypothetical protein [Patescibacteria group bacterium]